MDSLMEEGENTWRGQRQEDRRDMLSLDHLLHLHHLQQQQLLYQFNLIRKVMLSQDLLQQQKPRPQEVLQVLKVTALLAGRTGNLSSDTTVDFSRVTRHHTDSDQGTDLQLRDN